MNDSVIHIPDVQETYRNLDHKYLDEMIEKMLEIPHSNSGTLLFNPNQDDEYNEFVNELISSFAVKALPYPSDTIGEHAAIIITMMDEQHPEYVDLHYSGFIGVKVDIPLVDLFKDKDFNLVENRINTLMVTYVYYSDADKEKVENRLPILKGLN